MPGNLGSGWPARCCFPGSPCSWNRSDCCPRQVSARHGDLARGDGYAPATTARAASSSLDSVRSLPGLDISERGLLIRCHIRQHINRSPEYGAGQPVVHSKQLSLRRKSRRLVSRDREGRHVFDLAARHGSRWEFAFDRTDRHHGTILRGACTGNAYRPHDVHHRHHGSIRGRRGHLVFMHVQPADLAGDEDQPVGWRGDRPHRVSQRARDGKSTASGGAPTHFTTEQLPHG